LEKKCIGKATLGWTWGFWWKSSRRQLEQRWVKHACACLRLLGDGDGMRIQTRAGETFPTAQDQTHVPLGVCGKMLPKLEFS